MFHAFTIFSGGSFLIFGAGYLFSPELQREFVRYGLARVRVAVALLQIAGAAGQLLSLVYPSLAIPAALGLATMMGVAIIVRVNIGDTLLQMLPAIAYLGVNAYLLWIAIARTLV